MSKPPKRPRDPNQLAKSIVDAITDRKPKLTVVKGSKEAEAGKRRPS
jgi:hypothetical protein